MKKIYLLLSLLLCFGFALSTEVHASGPKIFEVNDVLPATTQLRISWDSGLSSFLNSGTYMIETIAQPLITIGYHPEYEVNVFMIHDIPAGSIYMDGWMSPYTDYSGGHNYIILDTSTWEESRRTIFSIDDLDCLYWEDLNAPSGYTITFNSNGGTTISDIEEATELPTELPIPTKTGYTFLGWYYDSDFTIEAFTDDPLTSDVTLYAKWVLNTYTIIFEENGGTTQTDLTEQTALPDPLPTPTKSGYSFLGWYYDSDFTIEAFADDPLTSDVTLYAKWGEKNKMTDITVLIIGLIIFIIANILGFIYKNNLLTALSGLLWLLPIFLVDNAIIKIFSIIIMLITFLFNFKERDDYYYD